MNNKSLLASILIIIFLGIMLFAGGKIVSNSRTPIDIGTGNTSSSTNSTAFQSKLKDMKADETLKDKLSTVIKETKVAGTGDREVKQGDKITVNYRGWLATDSSKVFDQSFDHGDTGFSFTVGQGVITGWSEGVEGMKVGEIRRLKIPFIKGYGVEGYPPAIPQSADLLFDVELISFN